MKQEHPEWLLLGCQAHALSLVIKDFIGEKTVRCAWSKRVYRTALMMSNTINGNDKVHAALKVAQQEKYSKTKNVRTHCPTRFAIMHMICRDLVATKDAIKTMCAADDWSDVAANCTHAAEFRRAALSDAAEWCGPLQPTRSNTVAAGAVSRTFWSEMDELIELIQPISDAIHQLEADRAMLSQVLPVWNDLIQRATAFDGKACNGGTRAVLPLFERRFKLHYDKSWASAHLADPMYAKKEGTDWCLAFTNLTAEQMDDAMLCIGELAGASTTDDGLAAMQAEWSKLQLGTLPSGMRNALPSLAKVTHGDKGKMYAVEIAQRRNFWTRLASATYPLFVVAAAKLLSFHVTSCSTERNWSVWGNIYVKCRNRLALERAEKLVTIRCSSKACETLQSDEQVVLTLLGKPREDSGIVEVSN
jgi:hypothetical protein